MQDKSTTSNFSEWLRDFFTFSTMFTPILILAFFWLSVIVCILTGIALLIAGEVMGGLFTIFISPFFLRIFFEFIMVIFRINETLTEIRNNLKKKSESSG